MHDVDNTIHVTNAYRIGQTNKSKLQPIIACLETEKQKYAAVKQAYRLEHSTKFQNVFISEDNFKSLDRNSSQYIRKWSNNAKQFVSGELN